MAHYRRGYKVPVMATRQRDVAGLLTVGFVFVLVAATAWRPLWFALPSLVVVVGLVIFDYAVVDTREQVLGDGPDRAADVVGFIDEDGLDVAALAAAQTRAYRTDADVTKAWHAPPPGTVPPPSPGPPVRPSAPPGRPVRPGPRRASWLDAPASGGAARQGPVREADTDDRSWDGRGQRDLDLPTGAVDMRAFLD